MLVLSLLLLSLMSSLNGTEETPCDWQMSKGQVISQQENVFLTSTDCKIIPKVNPLTGEYCEEECDLIVAGSQPLSLRRFYNHFGPLDRRYANWRYNPESFLVANLELCIPPPFVAVGDGDGGICCLDIDKRNYRRFIFQPSKSFATLHSEGRTHPLNIQLRYHKIVDPKDRARFQYVGSVKDGSGRERTFSSPMHRWTSIIKGDREYWGQSEEYRPLLLPLVWTPFHLPIMEERLPNGNILCYGYDHWKKPNKNRYPRPFVLASITAYNHDKSHMLGSLRFCYSRTKDRDITGIEVVGSDGRRVVMQHDNNLLMTSKSPNGAISYGFDRCLLNRIEKPQGRVFLTQYWENNFKVRAQLAPVGPQGELCEISRYEYQDRATMAYNAEGHLTIYRCDEDRHLVALETYQSGSLYSVDRFSWNIETGNLMRRAREDAEGRIAQITEYEYDARQNPILERVGDGITWRTIERTYSEDGFNLKLSEKVGNRLTRFRYFPNTDLLISELVCDGERICKRTFHSYDDCAVCIRTVIDDGHSEDPLDLSQVTYRTVKEVKPRQQLPCFGLPEVVEEKGAGKVIYSYTPFGKVLQEEHYDAEGVYRYAIENRYDDQEQLISKTDPLGHLTTFAYDANHNLISISGPREGQRKEIVYDPANRPIRITDRQSDGTLLIIENRYDRLGQVVEKVNASGHRTTFAYDALGRVIAVTHPDGAIERKEYDVLGNVVKEIDAEGYETRKSYNCFGQLLSAHYPDGSSEHFTYNPTGTIHSHTDKNGTTTLYTYDLFDHVIRAENPFKVTIATWSPFCKLSEIDGDVEVLYTYDLLGRKIGERRSTLQRAYTYDAGGHERSVREGEIETIQEYDLCDRVIKKRVEYQGVVQTEVSYGYDEAGNCTQVTGLGTTHTLFNTYGKPVWIQDALGYVTEVTYTYAGGLTKISRSPNGLETVQIHDSRDREKILLKRDREGRVIQQEETTYDLRGNRVAWTHLFFSGTTQLDSVTHRWTYGPCNRLESFLEGGKRETRYFYDAHGRLETIRKPNGSELRHEYDGLGRLARFYSTDFDYRYTYDEQNRVKRVYDAVKKLSTLREYDSLGNVLREHLANGLVLMSRYDERGKRTALTLPDGSKIAYTYAGDWLQSVSRRVYTHSYERNIEGAVVRSGDVRLTRDLLGRIVLLRSPGITEELQYDTVGNLVSNDFRDALGSVEERYVYDDLDQLIEERDHSYLFDSLHNRLEKDSLKYKVDGLCQVQHDGKRAYAYDACGNLISDGVRKYFYDSQDRLIRVEQGGRKVEYDYDPFHRRLSHREKSDTVRYLWDGDDEIGAVDERVRIFQLRVLGEGLGAEIGAATFYELDGRGYIPIHNHRGCVISLHDLPTRRCMETYRYTAFGEELTSGRLSPWRFSSKRVDEETGFIFFGRRYYNASLGRWITHDPQGFEDGPNLYAYVHNCPLTKWDLYGLYAWYDRPDFLSFPGVSYPHLAYSPLFGHGFEGRYQESCLFDLKQFGYRDLPYGAIGFVNGANTPYAKAVEHARYLGKLAGGYNIHGVYNATHGMRKDLVDCFNGLSRDIWTRSVWRLHDQWDLHFRDSDASYLQFCHSQGAIVTRLALEEYPDEKRKRINVVAVAPADYIPKELCQSVIHYEAAGHRDPIPRLNMKGRNRCQDTIQVLKSHPNADTFDHAFNSPTYEKKILEEIQRYLTMIGHK